MQGVGLTAGAGDGWTLHRAESDMGPWVRWSASAQTLLLGGAFAVLMVLTVGRLVLPWLPPEAAGLVRAVLIAAAFASLLPVPLLAVRHAARRLTAIDVDPTALTLHGPKGPVRVPYEELARAEPRAEPVFARRARGPGLRGAMADIPGFVATLRLRHKDGRVWEFHARRAEEVEAVLAWLVTLGVGRAVAGEAASDLAAQRSAEQHLGRARAFLVAAIGVVTVNLLVQALDRMQKDLVPALGLSFVLLIVGCLLYVVSFREQVQAAQAWLVARSLGSGPPARVLAELAPAAPPPPR